MVHLFTQFAVVGSQLSLFACNIDAIAHHVGIRLGFIFQHI